ncbi:cytochrome bd-I oxidase subunit CydX [Lysobacter enzymogenes]|uniref:Cytochrome bd-I oxidase subunit CydX n=1 Tax=Lysobacter enzymogenes TaxID=69 RepID=A0A3N2RAM0_LYSEN|nr:cytochrome bd-I oxidase subunit CydX [Lysobacter enzymogenes]ROU04463.1 cytochrome bd-I oxidase subunit CydX [Lysobacter enzymogenes]
MWYFAWILGLALACSFGVLNAMWFEMREDDEQSRAQARRGG